MSTRFVIIQVSFPKGFELNSLIEKLIQSKQAVCVHQFAPVKSFYEWEGQLESSEEVLIHIKAKQAHFKSIEETIRIDHPYDVAEIISIPIESMSQPYLDWATSI